MKPPIFSCLNSRIINNGSLYGRFLLGPLPINISLTLATILRRSLLHSQTDFAIVSAEIEGALHEYSSLTGIQESVLEILLNLGEIPLSNKKPNLFNSNLSSFFDKNEQRVEFSFAQLRVCGPSVVTAKDIKWPNNISCVKPDSYIATLSNNATLTMRIKIASLLGKKPIEKYNSAYSYKTPLKRKKTLSEGGKGLSKTSPFKPSLLNNTEGSGKTFRRVLPPWGRQREEFQTPLKKKNLHIPLTLNFSTLDKKTFTKVVGLGDLDNFKTFFFKNDKSNPKEKPKVKNINGQKVFYPERNGKLDRRVGLTDGQNSLRVVEPKALGGLLHLSSKNLRGTQNLKDLGGSIFGKRRKEKGLNGNSRIFSSKGSPLGSISEGGEQPLDLRPQWSQRLLEDQSTFSPSAEELGGSFLSAEAKRLLEKRKKDKNFLSNKKKKVKTLGFSGHILKEEPRSLNSWGVELKVSSSVYPVEKVNFLIERDDQLDNYQHRIIFEVWTNGSISPRQAIFNSIGWIIKLLYNFREPSFLPRGFIEEKG